MTINKTKRRIISSALNAIERPETVLFCATCSVCAPLVPSQWRRTSFSLRGVTSNSNPPQREAVHICRTVQKKKTAHWKGMKSKIAKLINCCQNTHAINSYYAWLIKVCVCRNAPKSGSFLLEGCPFLQLFLFLSLIYFTLSACCWLILLLLVSAWQKQVVNNFSWCPGSTGCVFNSIKPAG